MRFFQPRDHALDCIVEVGHRDGVGAAARRQQRSFVDEIGQIGAGESGRQGRDRLGIYAGRKLHLRHVHFQNCAASLLVGAIDQHLAVEAAGAQQRRIEDFGPVGGGENDEARTRIETVEFDQELVERLLLLVVPPGKRPDAAGAAQRIQLVNEDDGGRSLVSLLKQVAHPRSSDANEHLDEFRARYRVERHLGLARDGLGQQGLAGAGRADQQHAFRHASTEPSVIRRALEEVDDLAQFVLGFVDACDVGKCHAGIGFDVDFRLALSDSHQAAAKPLAFGRAFSDVPPQSEEQQHRHGP